MFVLTVYGMVPHLTAVLGTMLPMLGMAKQDNMRWVFSSGNYITHYKVCIVLLQLKYLKRKVKYREKVEKI
jgi:hypothetical protein